MQVTLMVDGSFCPDTGAGGFGYWIASYRGKLGGGGPMQSLAGNPTEVEMKAICNSLVIAVNEGLVRAGDTVLVQTDSKNSISAFEHRRIPGVEAERGAVAFLDHYKIERELSIIFRYVKGHSTQAGARYAANNHCDERAKRAMRKVRAQLKKDKTSVQATRGTECCCAEPWRLQDLRPIRIPGADVREVWRGLCPPEFQRELQYGQPGVGPAGV